jgi:hypothetical protein
MTDITLDKDELRAAIVAAVNDGTSDGSMSPATRCVRLDRVLQSVEREDARKDRIAREATKSRLLAEAKKGAAAAA